MHILLALASLFLVLLGGLLALTILDRIHSWSQRRMVQMGILVTPVMLLGLGIDGFFHVAGYTCLFITPFWDTLLGVVLPLLIGSMVFGAVVLGIVRLLLMNRLVVRRGSLPHTALQNLVDGLARQLHMKRPRVLICFASQPFALTYGLFRPTVLLSTWMIEHLDHRELEAVLVHEFEHILRHDYLVVWLATVLRDAFFYLPTSRVAYRQMHAEKELACDDLVVGATQRPLALASALTKVWLHAVEKPQMASFGVAQHLVERGEAINSRIERLLDIQERKTYTQTQTCASRPNTLVLLALSFMMGANAMIILTILHCDPVTLLMQLF